MVGEEESVRETVSRAVRADKVSSWIPIIPHFIPEFVYRFGNVNQPSADGRKKISAVASLLVDALQK